MVKGEAKDARHPLALEILYLEITLYVGAASGIKTHWKNRDRVWTFANRLLLQLFLLTLYRG